MSIAVINEENAKFWANVFGEIKIINGLKSVDEFYGLVEPIYGVGEVYKRLSGWRKTAYRNFLMSGDIVVSSFGEETIYIEHFGFGKLNNTSKITVKIMDYGSTPADWEDYVSRDEELTWEELCELLAK